MKSWNRDALSIRGWSQKGNKHNSSSGRSKSLGKFVKVCSKSRKEGHYKKDCRSKAPKKGKGSDDNPCTEVKITSS